jgi:cell wall-associated NlpC family hydrolase
MERTFQINAWKKKMKAILKNGFYFLLIIGLTWISGCRKRAQIIPPAKPLPAKERLVRTGYTVQVGAFTVLDNARRLTHELSQKGLNTYYFKHESGLYKVRFGDFATSEDARQKAESLLSDSVIKDYFIVKPEDYAVSRQSLFGEDYLRDNLIATAESFIGVEYAWGGASTDDGFDCSGLTMAVYQMNGLNLPRTSKEQYDAGAAVDKDQMMKGDLVFFFTSRNQKISHVGIYIGNEGFIHAPGKNKKIRKDSLTESYFRSHFAGARTYLK